MRVWALPDTVRVNPETALVIEDRPHTYKGCFGGDYRSSNSVWDAEAARVRVKAARNEFVAFQIVVESDRQLQDVDVTLAPLRNVNGDALPSESVELFKEWCVKIDRASTGYERLSFGPGWYPDALVPSDQGRPRLGIPFDLPDFWNRIGPDQRCTVLWVDIYVPRDGAGSASGLYTSEIRVVGAGVESVLSLELNVWDFALPDENVLPGAIYNHSLVGESPEVQLQYYHLLHRHRIEPQILYYRPELEIDGTDVCLDWSEYDSRLSRYLDGSAFTAEHGYNGPGEGIPIHHLMMPFDVTGKHGPGGWPLNEPEEGFTEEFEAIWRETIRQVDAHFTADHPEWKAVRIAFMNGLDESYNDDAYDRMAYYGKLLKEEAPGILHRIDGSYSDAAMDRLGDTVGLWLCHTVGYDMDTVEKFRARGIEDWFYGPMLYEQRRNSSCGSCTFTDLDLLTMRSPAWVSWKHRTVGWVIWEFDWQARSAWFDQETWKLRNENLLNLNGSGQLIYRGETMGLPGPVASIRLKQARRGNQDYLYFHLLEARDGSRERADALVDSVISGVPLGEACIGNTDVWNHNPEAWDAVRETIGEHLSGEGT